MSDLISIDVEALAEKVADLVVARLRAGNFGDMIDQAESPLGRRRHINLVRKGGPGVAQVGRRYLASRAKVQEALEKVRKPAEISEPDGNAFLRKIGL